MQRMPLAFLYSFSIQEKQYRGYTHPKKVGYKGYLLVGRRGDFRLFSINSFPILLGKCARTLGYWAPNS